MEKPSGRHHPGDFPTSKAEPAPRARELVRPRELMRVHPAPPAALHTPTTRGYLGRSGRSALRGLRWIELVRGEEEGKLRPGRNLSDGAVREELGLSPTGSSAAG